MDIDDCHDSTWLTFEQFLDFDDGTEINDYELVNGRLVLMPEPDDWHEAIASFLDFMFQNAYRQAGLQYAVKRRSALYLSGISSRRPDVAVTDQPKAYMGTKGIYSVPHLIVEIASSNWKTDIDTKVLEYQRLGVPEYWIVDCRDDCPKVIALNLENGKYKRSAFSGDEIVLCATFPELKLTAEQVLKPE